MTAALALAPLTLAMVAAGGGEATAHAFGQRYDLPLPLDFYLAGGTAVVLLTFAVAALSLRPGGGRRCQVVLPRLPRWLARGLAGATALLGLLLFFLVLAAGFFGTQSPTDNIAPVVVWVLWWVGLLLGAALCGNLWPRLDPWASLYRLARPRDRRPGPARPCWGAWPATVLLFVFAWLELASVLGEAPRSLALLVVVYSAGAWLAMALAGAAAWQESGDPFRRMFALFGRFAPLGCDEAGRPVLRLPGAGLRGRHPQTLGEVAFVLLVLAMVAFDGLSETPLWAAALAWLSESTTLRPALLWLSAEGVDLLALAKTAGLLLAFLGFFLLYALAAGIAARLGGGIGTGQAMRVFALSLLPIAIAYQGAHYLSYLLLAGQLAISLASDPLGLGWDLFGTRGFTLDIGVIGAKTVWYVALAAIVVGHAIAVTLAHGEALALFATRRRAFLSQIPLLLLMLAFTATSLWILAQPIVQEPG